MSAVAELGMKAVMVLIWPLRFLTVGRVYRFKEDQPVPWWVLWVFPPKAKATFSTDVEVGFSPRDGCLHVCAKRPMRAIRLSGVGEFPIFVCSAPTRTHAARSLEDVLRNGCDAPAKDMHVLTARCVECGAVEVDEAGDNAQFERSLRYKGWKSRGVGEGAEVICPECVALADGTGRDPSPTGQLRDAK